MKKPNKTLMFNGYEVAFKLSTYQNNGRIAVVIYEYTSYGCAYEYGVASVNIDDFTFSPAQTYMDENNNSGITQLFIDNNLATNTGYVGSSGYCQYPLVELDLDALKDYCIFDDGQEDFSDLVANASDNSQSFADFLKECEEWDDVEREDANDDEDVDALLRDLFGVEEDDKNE